MPSPGSVLRDAPGPSPWRQRCDIRPPCGGSIRSACVGGGVVCPVVLPDSDASRNGAHLFQPTCVNGNNGWPRFASLNELRASPWAKYIRLVYGELPREFPVCIFDFWSLDRRKLDAANIATPSAHAPAPVLPRLQPKFDQSRFAWSDGELFERLTASRDQFYHGWAIYHSDRPLVRSNEWVEVTHHVATNTRGTGIESTAAKYANMWFSYTPGSGVWYWTGRAALFDSHVQAARELCPRVSAVSSRQNWTRMAIANDNYLAVCARRAGFDTVSFRTSRPSVPNKRCRANQPEQCWAIVTRAGTVATWGYVGLIELFATRLSGAWPCGQRAGGRLPGAERFRAGWRASRVCDCDNSSAWLNCRVSGRS